MAATQRNEVQRWDARRLRAVDLLAEGRMDSEVAEHLGVDRSTVWRWRTTDLAFVAELNRRREELWHRSGDRLRAMLPDALNVIQEALADGDRQAALALVKLARLGEVDLGRVGPTDVAQVQRDQVPEQPRKRTAERLAELWEIALDCGLVFPAADAPGDCDVPVRASRPDSGRSRGDGGLRGDRPGGGRAGGPAASPVRTRREGPDVAP